MNDEKDMILLTSFISLGIFVVSGITAYFHSWIVLPLAIIGLIFVPFILMGNKPSIAHLIENLEKIAFFITFFIIIISFIYLYSPV